MIINEMDVMDLVDVIDVTDLMNVIDVMGLMDLIDVTDLIDVMAKDQAPIQEEVEVGWISLMIHLKREDHRNILGNHLQKGKDRVDTEGILNLKMI